MKSAAKKSTKSNGKDYQNIRLGEYKAEKRNGKIVTHPLIIFGDPTMPDMIRFRFGKSKATQVLAAIDEMGPQKFRDFLYEFVEQ